MDATFTLWRTLDLIAAETYLGHLECRHLTGYEYCDYHHYNNFNNDNSYYSYYINVFLLDGTTQDPPFLPTMLPAVLLCMLQSERLLAHPQDRSGSYPTRYPHSSTALPITL